MRITTLLGILLITLQACSTPAPSNKISSKKSGPSKQDIVHMWSGKSVGELIDKYGQPDIIINTTLKGRPETRGYVYEQARLAGKPNCMNVYVVVTFNRKIHDHFCR